jgi:hypothetical protein
VFLPFLSPNFLLILILAVSANKSNYRILSKDEYSKRRQKESKSPHFDEIELDNAVENDSVYFSQRRRASVRKLPLIIHICP